MKLKIIKLSILTYKLPILILILKAGKSRTMPTI